MKKIILASASPRRAQLLRQVGLDFQIIVSDAEEVITDLPPAEFVKSTAFQKARIVSKAVPEGVIIAADTVVVIDGKIVGKPADAQEARKILYSLSGRQHKVYTGLCIIDMPSGHYYLGNECTKVYFRQLDEIEINAYIETGEPYDKAGAYGIQGKGAVLVERIEGCYFNVVGLPLSLLHQAMVEFGIDLLSVEGQNEKEEPCD